MNDKIVKIKRYLEKKIKFRRQAYQEQAKHDADSRSGPSLCSLLALKIGLGKFQCGVIFFGPCLLIIFSHIRENSNNDMRFIYWSGTISK